MSFLFPVSNETLENTKEIIAILPNIWAQIAFLSRDSISIRDAFTNTVKELNSFTRTPESIKQSGTNSWIQWFNRTTIFYGTSSGTIFMSKVHSLSSYKELCISKIILSTFICHDNLCLTTSNSQIYFINSKCEINYFVTLFDLPRPIRQCSFYSSSTLSCIVDDKPYFVTIDKNLVESKYLPIPQEIPITNIRTISLSLKRNLLAASNSHGDIILINVSPKRIPPILAYKEDRNKMVDFVVHMFWAMNDLLLVAIKESGKIIIWFTKAYEVTFQELQTAICFGYDHQTQRLYWSDSKNVNFISFASIISHYAVTSSQIINLFTFNNKEYELETKGVVVFADCETFFPIKLFASNKHHFAVASLDKVSIDGKVTIDIEAIGISFLDSFLVIFSIHSSELKYFMNFYQIQTDNEQLFVSQVGMSIPFLFKSTQINVFQNEMVVFYNKQICRIRLRSDPLTQNDNDEIEQLNIELVVTENETKYLSLSFQSFPLELNGISLANPNTLFLFCQNCVFTLPKGPFLAQNIEYMWSCNEGIPYTFMLSNETTMISCFTERVRVVDYPIMTDGYRLFSFKSKINELGKFEFETQNVGGFFLAHLAHSLNSEDDAFSILNQFYRTNLPSDYPFILAEAIVKAFPIEKEMIIINNINKKGVSIVAIALAVQKMPKEMRCAMLKHEEIDWQLIIPIFKGNLLYTCLMNITHKKFMQFCDTKNSIEQIKEPHEIIKRTINDHNLIRGFLFSMGLAKVDLFVQLLKDDLLSKNYSLKFCLDLMNDEKRKLADLDDAATTLKFFGCMMQGSELSLLSLATFVVINEKFKIASVIIVDESIREDIRNYVELFADSQFTPILVNSITQSKT